MKKVDGTPKTIRVLFTGVKYTIHYYQREYQWQTKQIEELIDDLTEEFFEFPLSVGVLTERIFTKGKLKQIRYSIFKSMFFNCVDTDR
jgi:uncharacterized protein with ParB-like and HNH nuclease domain